MESKNIIGGLAGAVVLTILNESLKNVNENMPHIDLVGKEAVQKTAEYFGLDIENESLFGTAIVSDILSNTAYYSMIDGEENDLWLKAASSGILGGLSAVNLPEKIGLNDEPVTKTFTTKALVVGYYLAGALTTAAVIRLMERIQQK
ncbi:hypothetical protein [Flavobacterium seoulense]|uniref:Uncharacterized protein n=1 Tax=Flavobacterium seoulense TaxID=1492738 RepID=A0A066WP33_9FLAO|nr:hypothetical protein [Flavobacterium seoulense]KDN55631.1 hypothetical protein FEM21_12330 [Flavobacterium seoulense]